MSQSSTTAHNGHTIIDPSMETHEHTTTFMESLTTHNAYPLIPWITESWLAKLVRHERIAVASPRIGMGLICTELIQHHIDLIPTLHSAADFAPVHDEDGHYLGVRPKMATWPLTKEDVLRQREWAA